MSTSYATFAASYSDQHHIVITRAANGFILSLHNEDSDVVRVSIAEKYNIRGYGGDNLCTAIEDLWQHADAQIDAAKINADVPSFTDDEAEAINRALNSPVADTE